MPTATWEHGGSPLFTDIGTPPAGVSASGSGSSTPDFVTAASTWSGTGNENGDLGTVNFTADGGSAFFAAVAVLFQIFDDGSFTGTDPVNTVRLVFDWALTSGPMGTGTAKSAFNSSVDASDDVHGPGVETGTYDRTTDGATFGTPTMADLFTAFDVGGPSAIGLTCVFYYDSGTFSAHDRRVAISNLQFIVNYGSLAVVTNVSPTHGDSDGGTVVTLTGTGFTGATTVTFNGSEAVSVNVLSDTSLTCITTEHAVGQVTVTVE